MRRPENPFEITKAVDMTDREINSTFVDLPGGGGGFAAVVDPRSPMSHFIIGGKGGGRTHLMRHLSYTLQVMDAASPKDKVISDGYLGVYFRCSGLNASRFGGKRQAGGVWTALFAYYMDVWFCRLLVEILRDIGSRGPAWGDELISDLGDGVFRAFDEKLPCSELSGIDAVVESLSKEIRALDRIINNAAFQSVLDVDIKAAPGAALFAVSSLVSRLLLNGARITFLIDEFENLKPFQQRYVNTLVREKPEQCTFIIGSRTEGLRTFETMSAGEVNQVGSEYYLTTLEEVYGSNRPAYRSFCSRVAISRLSEGESVPDEAALKRMFPPLTDRDVHRFSEVPTEERPHRAKLRRSLAEAIGEGAGLEQVMASLSVSTDALEEKFRILRFYQRWSSGSAPDVRLADRVKAEFEEPPSRESGGTISEFRRHRKWDMIAQLYVESGQKVPYGGFDQFVDMAGFLPRSLLVILKNSVRWAQFMGEYSLAGSADVSVRAQSEGVRDAAEWFLREASAGSADGEQAASAVRRLGGYLRKMRFSDKPVEVSCATFSTDRRGLTDSASATLAYCVAVGLLVDVQSGQIDRNSGAFHSKYQVSPMIAPYFDLPTGRRGVTKLTRDEMNAIFSSTSDDEAVDRAAKGRLAGMNAPFVLPMEGQDALFD